MQIFDCHFHITNGLEGYDIRPDGKNIIFNTIDEYRQKKGEKASEDKISLIFDYKSNLDLVASEVKKGGISALKIHSRIQKISEADYPMLFDAFEKQIPKGIPVIFDAFYFGSDLDFQPNLKKITEFAKRFKENPVIVAHSGGIRVLEFFLHLKELENVYFDLSFSLAYLSHAAVYQDFKVLIKFGNPQRIMFGTDFPFISAKDQLNHFFALAQAVSMSEQKQHQILFENAHSIFQ